MKRGRPRRWKGIRITSFYIPEEFSEIYEKLREMAFEEGVPVNNKILEAITEYVKNCSGGREIRIPEELKMVDEAKKVEAEVVAQDLKEAVSLLKAPNIRSDFRLTLAKEMVPKLVMKLAKLNAYLKNPEYVKLCHEAISLTKEVRKL